MESNSTYENALKLCVITPEGQVCAVECDSVRFNICDDRKGKSSGSYGVRKGHAKAVFSIRAGEIIAQKDGETVFSVDISDGFAVAEQNILTVTAESASLTE